MGLSNSKQSYGLVTIVVHWATALMVAGMFGLGLWMSDLTYQDPWYHSAPLLHKRIGVVIFLLTVFRIVWRLVQPTPLPPPTTQAWEKYLSLSIQGLLYLLLLLLPIAGYLIVTAKGQPFDINWGFSIPALPWHLDKDDAEDIHAALAWTLMGVAGLHAAAALKHHFISRDNILLRMLGSASRG